MEMQQNKRLYVIVGLVLLAVIALIVCLVVAGQKTETAATPLTAYWTSDSPAAQSLRDYVAKVTDPENKADFIPEKDRIAVFDMDGTLACETY